MPALLAHLPSHRGMAMQGIAGHDAAFQRHGLQRRQRRRYLVAVCSDPRRDRQAGLCIPDADQQRRHAGTSALVATAQTFAVHRDDAFTRTQSKTSAHGCAKAVQGNFHLFGIEQPEQPAEGVVAGCAIGGQVHEFNKFRPVGCREVGNIDAALRTAQRRRERDQQQG